MLETVKIPSGSVAFGSELRRADAFSFQYRSLCLKLRKPPEGDFCGSVR